MDTRLWAVGSDLEVKKSDDKVGSEYEPTRGKLSVPTPKVLLFGHSHIGAIIRAYAERDAGEGLGVDLHAIQCIRAGVPHIVHGQHGWEYHPDGLAELRRAIEKIRPSAIFFSLQGEQAIWAGMLPPERAFDFFFPGDSRALHGTQAEVIPFDLVMEIARGSHHLAASFLDQAMPLFTVPTFGLSPPPPVGDQDFILDHMRGHEVYSKLKEQGLAPRAWRGKIWKAHVLALADIYQARGCSFLEPPDGTLEQEGFLLSSLYSDAFHANQAYGALVLAQMIQVANQMTG